MPNIPDKTDSQGQFLTAVELNPFKNSLQNAITDAGGTLIASDSLQFRQALNSYTSIANFYIDTGTATEYATEYVLNPQGAFKAPIDASTTWNGMLIRFRPTHNNLGVVTLRLAGLNGGLPFNTLREDGTAIQAGDFLITKDAILRYNSTADAFMLLTVPVRNASQTVAGISYINKQITIANNVTDANNDIDFTSGTFTFSDYTGMASVGAMTKRLDASWTAGTNNGGLDTGSKANGTWYHCYAIYNPTTQVSDFIFSANATNPTLPSGFTKYKYLGSVLTNVSANIIAFTQNNNEFKWTAPIQENFDALITTSNKTLTLTVPPVLLKPNVSCYWQGGSAGTRVERLDFTSNLTGVYYMQALTFGTGTAFPHYFDTVINKMIINDKNILYKATVGGAGGTGFCYTNGYYNLAI